MNRTRQVLQIAFMGLLLGSMELLWSQAPMLVWRFNGNATPSAPVSVANGVAYFPCKSKLYAVNLTDGTLKWQYPAGNEALDTTFITRPLVTTDSVYLGAGNGNLYAFDVQTGRLKWVHSARSGITGAPILVGDTIFFGTGDGQLLGVNAISGEANFKPLKVGDDIYGQPLVVDDSIVFASHDNKLYCATIGGQPRWSASLPNPMSDPQPVYAGGNLYVTGANMLIALNLVGGRTKWQQRFPVDLPYAPAADESGVYVITSENKAYAFDHSGKPIWDVRKPLTLAYTPAAAPVVAQGTLWITTKRGTVYGFDVQNGDLKWAYTLRPLPGVARTPSGTLGTGGGETVGLGAYGAGRGQITTPPTRTQDYIGVSRAPVVIDKGLLLTGDDGSLLMFSTAWVDRLAPDASELIPSMGEPMSGQLPIDIYVRLRDEGSGVNPSTVQILLDGSALVHEYDAAKGLVTVKLRAEGTIRPLPDGRHTLTVVASDWAGNTLNQSWAIYVDNTLKKTTRRPTQPGPGAGGPAGRGGGAKGGGGGRGTGSDY